jgi:hypothetical protein
MIGKSRDSDIFNPVNYTRLENSVCLSVMNTCYGSFLSSFAVQHIIALKNSFSAFLRPMTIDSRERTVQDENK